MFDDYLGSTVGRHWANAIALRSSRGEGGRPDRLPGRPGRQRDRRTDRADRTRVNQAVGEPASARRYRSGVRLPVSGTVAVVSYRLGGEDGVSIEAAKWAWAFRQLGFDVTTVAGTGEADRLIPGLAMDPVDLDISTLQLQVGDALSVADLVLVENLCSLPLSPV